MLEPAGAMALAAAHSWLARKQKHCNKGAGEDQVTVVAIASGANAALPSLTLPLEMQCKPLKLASTAPRQAIEIHYVPSKATVASRRSGGLPLLRGRSNLVNLLKLRAQQECWLRVARPPTRHTTLVRHSLCELGTDARTQLWL